MTHSSFVEPACAELYINGQFICFSIVALHSEKKSALTEPSLWSYVCIASTSYGNLPLKRSLSEASFFLKNEM